MMGWAQGEHNGKLVGYAVEDVCNRPDCETPIDRGLAYACGGRHGEDSGHCDGYFCAEHLYFSDEGFVCESCLTEVEELS